MKKAILLALLMPCMASGQIVINFESGNTADWVQSPEGHWNADNTSSISGNYSLHHKFDDNEAGTSLAGLELLHFRPSRGDSEWSFKVRHGCDPSASNNWCVLIMSDTDPATVSAGGRFNGFAAGVNQTGYDDTLRLWKVKNETFTTVASAGLNWQTGVGTDNPVRIDIERTEEGAWTITVCDMNEVQIGSGRGSDPELFSPDWLIVLYKYTSTRDRLLWVDDITVNGLFSDDEEDPPITDPDPLALAETGDVIITEIMADPAPVVGLPDKEYMEIRNNADSAISLLDWKMIAGNQTITFPQFVIQPSEYVIICPPADTTLFRGYGRTLGLKSFPVLTDGGKILCLSDSKGSFIHGVEYSSSWYGDALKSGGGWSLEMIDTCFPFSGEENWSASVSKSGGTPGMPNSVQNVNPDMVFHGILNVYPEDNHAIRVKFSETVIISPGDTGNIKIDNHAVSGIYPSDPLMREYIVIPEEPLAEGRVYSLNITGKILDLSGNPMQINSFNFGITVPPGDGDILFNELLFNPLPGDADYIELYNCSDKILDASDLLMASVNDDTGVVSSAVAVSPEGRCILPKTYYAVTTGREGVIARYFSSDPLRIFKVASMPSMPDREGHLLLLNRSLEEVDEVRYSETMHFPLLSGVEGIALEKLRPDGPSRDQSGWHTASEASGWGTPGRINSVFIDKPASSDEVHLSSTRITPDNDGFEDLLVIDLKMKGNGNVVSVTIFNETGGFVRQLADNLFAGSEATIAWDGTAADGSPLRNGIYILLITIYDDRGKTNRWRRVCTVLR